MTKRIGKKGKEDEYRHIIYAFGKAYDFHRITSDTALDNDCWVSSVAEDEKTQIFLHCTASNNTAEGTVTSWNNAAIKKRKLKSEGKTTEAKNVAIGSANYVIERKDVTRVTRGPLKAGTHKNDSEYVDCLEVLESEKIAYATFGYNTGSVGIEIENKAHGMKDSEKLDANHYIKVPSRYGMDNHAYQAFEDEQYGTLILLLRYLCMKHGIPRKFLGQNGKEMFTKWISAGNAQKKYTKDFSGILHHRNVTKKSKTCPGVLYRDRLYRGIIDEWWLPIQPNGKARAYYSGPFQTLPNPEKDKPVEKVLHFWKGTNTVGIPTVESFYYSSGDIEKLAHVNTYFNQAMVDRYFELCETPKGGIFPVGRSKAWHGGIHLYPQDSNAIVYAACSGTIVAARVTNNRSIAKNVYCGCQGFVLLRHYVYTQTKKDDHGMDRIDYSVKPKKFYSLYMHLEDVTNQDGKNSSDQFDSESDDSSSPEKTEIYLNPPWYDRWLASHDSKTATLDETTHKGKVFNPDIEVNVGDVLGVAGSYMGSRCLHFEIISGKENELKMAPWNNPKLSIQDPEVQGGSNAQIQDIICDSKKVDQFLKDIQGDGIDDADVLAAAPKMRQAKAFSKSEWSLKSANALTPCIPNKGRRQKVWNRIKYLMWWDEAMQVNAELKKDLGTDGVVWHYHPIEFMKFVNGLIEKDNKDKGIDYRNVTFDDQYMIRKFLNSKKEFVKVDASHQKDEVKTYRTRIGKQSHFEFQDIACSSCVKSSSPPESTCFNWSLFLLLQKIREDFNSAINVDHSFICSTHTGKKDGEYLCILENKIGEELHHKGYAIDFSPGGTKTKDLCEKLFKSGKKVIEQESKLNDELSFFDYMPEGYNNVELIVHPASAGEKLKGGKNDLTAEEIKSFALHMNLVAKSNHISPLNTYFVITFHYLEILDDLDDAAAGEWEWSLKLDGKEIFKFNQSVSDKDKIQIKQRVEKKYPAGTDYSFEIIADGKEDDLTMKEAIGEIRKVYSKKHPPIINKLFHLTNAKKTCRLYLTIEAPNTQITSV